MPTDTIDELLKNVFAYAMALDVNRAMNDPDGMRATAKKLEQTAAQLEDACQTTDVTTVASNALEAFSVTRPLYDILASLRTCNTAIMQNDREGAVAAVRTMSAALKSLALVLGMDPKTL